jgi:hypothetical protein
MGLPRAPTYRLHGFCDGAEKDKLQISRALGEFVLRNWHSHAFCLPVFFRECKSATASAVSARTHKLIRVAMHSANQSTSRNVKGQPRAPYLEARKLSAGLETERRLRTAHHKFPFGNTILIRASHCRAAPQGASGCIESHT